MWTNLKQAIDSVIRTNDNQEITGAILNNTLKTIVDTVGANASYAGVATPSTNPGTPDGPIFYFATEAGTYVNFGGATVTEGLTVLFWDCITWTATSVFDKENMREVFDISEYHSGATYVSLASALGTDGANVPSGVRKGGMSIKFVLSSDNKYVQYRYMGTSIANADFTNVANWQGVETEFTPNSRNLVESGVVNSMFAKVAQSIYTQKERYPEVDGYVYVNESGVITSGIIHRYIFYLPVKKGDKFVYNVEYNGNIPAFCIAVTSDTTPAVGSPVLEYQYIADAGNETHGIYEVKNNGTLYFFIYHPGEKFNCYLLSNYLMSEEYKNMLFTNGLLFKNKSNIFLPYYIKGDNTWDFGGKSILIPVKQGDIIEMTYNGSAGIRYAVLNTYNLDAVDYVIGRTQTPGTFNITIPQNGHYLYVSNMDSSDTSSRMPSSIKINGVGVLENFLEDTILSRQYNTVFIGGGHPSFVIEENQATVTLPINALRIYDVIGGNYYSVTNQGGESFTSIYNGKVVVFDLDDNTVKEVALGSSGRYLLLFSYWGRSVSGLLAKYYYTPNLQFVLDNTFITKSDISEIVPTASNTQDGKCINRNGTIINEERGHLIGPLLVGDGETVELYVATGSFYCVFAECNSDGTGIKPVINGDRNDSKYIYRYSSIGSNYIYISVRNSASALPDYIKKYKNILVREQKDLLKDGDNNKAKICKANNDLMIAHFSDIHSDKDSASIIIHSATLLGVDDILHTGDNPQNSYIRGFGDLFYAKDFQNVLNVVGNHDGAVPIDGGGYTWNGTPVTDVYNTLFKPYVSGWNVTQPSDAEQNGKCYYYKDYANKVRMIVLNESYWDSTQLAWLNSVLDDARTNNLSVLAVKHSSISGITNGLIDCRFSNKYAPNPLVMFGINDARNAIDSFIQNGGKFVCWIAGHGHVDGIYKYENSGRVQIVVCITTSSSVVTTDTPLTTIPTLFNIFGVNTTDETINLIRIGANVDKRQRICNSLCLKYTDGSVVYDS